MKIVRFLIGSVLLAASFFAFNRCLNSATSIVEYIPTLCMFLLAVFLIRSTFKTKLRQ